MVSIKCPVVKCQNTACTTGSFLLDYRNRGCLPEVKQTVIDMSLNASGIRDTACVLRISTDTVISELRSCCKTTLPEKLAVPRIERGNVYGNWKSYFAASP